MTITALELRQITDAVWRYTLDRTLSERNGHHLGADVLAARVGIHGAWEGALLLKCSREIADRWARIMFAKAEGEVTAEEGRDALGELANMIAGNVKSLLGGDLRLGLPAVSEWLAPGDPRSGTVTAALSLDAEGEALEVILVRRA